MDRAPRKLLRVSTALAALALTTLNLAAADSGSTSSQCIYRDSHYGVGALICVGPQVGQKCSKDGWADDVDFVAATACTGASIPSPGAPPPAQCTYRDTKYTQYAVICVAPGVAEICNKDGSWTPAAPDLKLSIDFFKTACAAAQIPTWNPAPSSSSSK
jgi:hypothetical protein